MKVSKFAAEEKATSNNKEVGVKSPGLVFQKEGVSSNHHTNSQLNITSQKSYTSLKSEEKVQYKVTMP